MSRKDYVLIAESLLKVRKNIDIDFNNKDIARAYVTGSSDTLMRIINRLEDSLTMDNPKFDHNKFMDYIYNK